MKSIVIDGPGASAPALRVWPGIGKAVRILSATFLYAAALSAPGLAYAAHGGGGGGGFHGGGAGGGFHTGGAGALHGGGFAGGVYGTNGFHGGGFHAGGFSGGGIHPGASLGADTARFHIGNSREDPGGNSIVLRGGERAGERAGQWHRGWHDGRFGYWWGYDPYLWSDDGAYDGSYAYGEPYAAQSSYFCSDPAGYYPYVTQCNTAWQTAPGG